TILLIGEGNFSFAHSLAKRLGSAQNITATAFDTRPIALEKYHDAQIHLDALQEMGGEVLFGVDGTALDKVEELKGRSFSHIVFNFPHAGAGIKDQTKNILTNQVLMMGFFESSVSFLHKGTAVAVAVKPGQIHVALKSGPPYSHWNIRQLAKDSGLMSRGSVVFDFSAFPGYEHRRTLGFKEGVSKDENREIKDKDPLIHMFVV
ncbi:hypothetical protein BX661DRAFT_124512, partial [Kickxella alabastrina]|uniref:uncharacterized protein n=1 Tax=Kickxella alabastrina TaxID=61397 RepID=UPI00221FBF13